ncbi:MAG: GNAT family N-acetyltransferase [Bacteroidota bacterium]
MITDQTDKIDRDFVLKSLNQTYWAENRTKQINDTAIDHSICLSLFDSEKQIGFARIVTDNATFAWIADVFIDPQYRGLGLGKWLVDNAVNHEKIRDVGLKLLKTKDAHELYKKYGFYDDGCMVLRKEP